MATESTQLPTQLRPTHELNLEKVLAMGKGDGEHSYSKNSAIQAAFNKLSLPALNEALERVSLPSRRLVVADLGSSSGPNAIDNMSLILDKLGRRLGEEKCVEFQACFNDLPSNDFNNLFQLLSNDSRVKNCYVAGVPGSFYGRLFPESSVDVFFSSISLQWLSQIPDVVLDEQSSTYNRDSSWILHSRPAVAKSFQQQASVDLKNFLSARAAELVPGGLLFFWCLGRPGSEPHVPTNCTQNYVQFHADEVWSELVEEGIVTEHDQSTFNFPVYLRSVEEVEEAIASCGLFNVLTVELQTINTSLTKLYGTSEPGLISRKISALYKAIFNDLLEAEVAVGKKISGIFWQRFAKSCEKGIRMSTEDPKLMGNLCIVSLIRK